MLSQEILNSIYSLMTLTTREDLQSDLCISLSDIQSICQEAWDNPDKQEFDILDLMVFWRIASDTEIPIKGMGKYIDSKISLLPEEKTRTLHWLKSCVLTEVTLGMESRANESSICTWFSANLDKLIPGSKLIKVEAVDKKRPDFLIEISGVVYPVECKKDFTICGLKQLEEYMSLWKVDKGYAVSRKLSCKLPSSIIHIKAAGLKP